MIGRFLILVLVLTVSGGCAEQFTVFHSKSGEPILFGLRAYSYEDCLSEMRAEASRLRVSLQYIHVRGSVVGRSLLWPFEPGFACEAAIGPEQPPSGSYLNVPPQSPPKPS